MNLEPALMEAANELEQAPGEAAADDLPDARVPARLIEYARGRQMALPVHTTLDLVENPVVTVVPGAAYYAYGLMAWQGRQLPLISLDALLQAHGGASRPEAPRYALVVAYQRARHGPVEHGALGLSVLPQTIAVGDGTQCDLPTDSDLWPLLALSCFRHEKRAVPILDTARLFGAYHG